MKARNTVPYAMVLLVLVAVLLFVFSRGGVPTDTQTPSAQAAAESAPAASPSDTTGAGTAPLPAPAQSTAAVSATSVLGQGPSEAEAALVAPPQTYIAQVGQKRVRPVRLRNLENLQGARGEIGKEPSERRFDFELFPGQTLTGVSHTLQTLPLEEEGQRHRGVYIGEIEGIPHSLFTLAFNDEGMSASIMAGPLGNYVIQPAPGGWYTVVEADRNNPDACGIDAARMQAIVEQKLDQDRKKAETDALVLDEPIVMGPADGKVSKLATPATPVTFDVMVVFTDDLRAFYGGAALVNAVVDSQTAFANQVFVNSLVGAIINIVHTEEIAYTETSDLYTDLAAVSYPDDGRIDQVISLRNQHGADLVSFWIQGPAAGGFLGLAYLTYADDQEEFGFSVVRPQFDAITFIHELGHNLGCAHNPEDANTPGRFFYSFGYRVQVGGQLLLSIMSYPPDSGASEYRPYFSNPDVLVDGQPFGQPVVLVPQSGANNALTINFTVEDIVNFRDGPGSGGGGSPPAPPTNVQATDGAYPAAVLVQWSASTGATSYEVYRSNSNSTGGASLLGLTQTGLAFEDKSPNPGQVHYYFVKALNANGKSAFSGGDAGRTSTPALGTPGSVSASNGTDFSFVRITFGPVANAERYEIFRNTANTLTGAQLLTTIGFNGEVKDYSAMGGINYYYWVRARKGTDQYGPYGGSDIGWAKIPPLPQKGQNLRASASSPYTFIKLNWDAAADAARYELVRATSNSPSAGQSILITAHDGVRQFNDFTSVPGVKYYYFVRALNAAGAGPWSDVCIYTLQVQSLLPPPGNFRASNGTDDLFINLTWDPVADSAGYFIYRNTVNNTATADLIGTVGPNLRDLKDYGADLLEGNLQQDTVYHYWVRTRNGQGGLSTFGAYDTGWLRTSPPETPRDCVATDGLFLDFVRISWEVTWGAAEYEIFRDKNPGNVNTKIGEVSANLLVFDDFNTEPGVIYYYRVRAVNSDNTHGNFSNTDGGFRPDPTTVAPPLTPTGLAATESLEKQIRVTWTGSLGAGQYQVFRSTTNAYVGTQIAATEATSYLDKDVLPETIYYYYVVAVSAAGVSPPSNIDGGEALFPADTDLTIALSDNILRTFSIPGQPIGTFTTTPVEPNTRTFSYALVTGDGDDDNALFTITGDQLESNFSPLDADIGEYTIRVRSTANDDPFIISEAVFTIRVIAFSALTSALQVDPTTGNIILNWQEMPGQWFQVQKNSGLGEEGWTNFGAPTQQKSMILSTAGGDTCFYRVTSVAAP